MTDLAGMFGATDIPEWVVAEGLGARGDAAWPLRAEQLVELHRRSPISVVDGVRAPSLMLLGAGDLRVPPSQVIPLLLLLLLLLIILNNTTKY